jgi:hypothetical protein
MFASLRNKFSNYRMCSLSINIEENIIIEAFKKTSLSKLSLRFDTFAITAPHYSISRGAFAVSERVCTTEAWAAHGGVYDTGS